jgi:hypothetical protein
VRRSSQCSAGLAAFDSADASRCAGAAPAAVAALKRTGACQFAMALRPAGRGAFLGPANPGLCASSAQQTWRLRAALRWRANPPATMADKDEILDAISALAATVRDNHADVMGKIDVIANGTGRIEAELGTVKADVRELQSSVARIETKLDRLEALEARP